MALRKNNIQITVVIDGIALKYNCTQPEAELLQKVEEIINREIKMFRQSRDNASADYNKMLIAVMIRLVSSALRKENDSEDTLGSLKEINSQLAEYLQHNK